MAEILEAIQAHFSQYHRPADFINRRHCDECEAHYRELLEVTVEQLQYKHLENQGWDPSCFLSPDGFRYCFPGLARIADQHRADWLGVLLSRLGLHYLDTFSPQDRTLVQQLLRYWWLQEDVSEWDRTDIGRLLEAWGENA